MKKIEEYIRTIPDFPKPGILFRDITAALADPEGLQETISEMTKLLEGVDYNKIAGAEARGFLLGMPLAYNEKKAFISVRKKGKLPCETEEESYALEYGTATIEVDKASIKPGDKVVLVDDLIATGGTMKAACRLVERLGGEVVKIIALVELVDLKGREVLSGYDVEAAIAFEGE